MIGVIIGAVAIAGVLTGGLFAYRAAAAPTSTKHPDDILPNSRSGTHSYQPSHDVFTNNQQESISYSPSVPTHVISMERYLDSLPEEGRYTSSSYGNLYARQAADNIARNGRSHSIEYSLVETSNTMNNWWMAYHRPTYRLGNETDIEAPQEDFEVLVITGSPRSDISNDAARFSATASVFEHSITRTYGDLCHEFQTLSDPNEDELIRAIENRTRSARENNRRLYIVYSGHGSHYENSYQEGVAQTDRHLQGSRCFQFNLNNIEDGFDENRYKDLLQRLASDIHVTSIILGCHSGAAVTAIEPQIERELQLGFA